MWPIMELLILWIIVLSNDFSDELPVYSMDYSFFFFVFSYKLYDHISKL